ncbi:WG repeat-containing protein [Haloglycomyces albus]|uniref:WG repeat-containing protein n=1 Tax=Haloglycomyces albus TaxID=526067 RepID=UPI00046D2A97|nr:tetratricopeptide repeat protein [Haloglycomyces albus]
MADVASDLRAGLAQQTGPLDPDTFVHAVHDLSTVQKIRDEATARLDRFVEEAEQSRLYGVRSVAERMLENLDAAETDAITSLTSAETVGTDFLLSPARARLAQVLRVKGRFSEAERLFALAERGEIPLTLVGGVRAYAGVCSAQQKRMTEALVLFEQAVDDNPHDFILHIAETGIEVIEKALPTDGFGPLPRSWPERAGFPAPEAFQDPQSGLWGFLTADGTAVKLAAQFTAVGPFRGGIAAVKTEAWGAIDRAGNVVVPLMYDALHTPTVGGDVITGFVAGAAVAAKDGRLGVVGRTGRVLVPFHYQHVIAHAMGYIATVDSFSWAALSLEGQDIATMLSTQDEAMRLLDSLIVIDDGPI